MHAESSAESKRRRREHRDMIDTHSPLLIVEDDPALQKQMTWAFEHYAPVSASDGESASAIRRHHPAVVTMDSACRHSLMNPSRVSGCWPSFQTRRIPR